MENENIICKSDCFAKQDNNFLLDSGAEMNLVKLSILKDEVKVNEKKRRKIIGISEPTVNTIDTVDTIIKIQDAMFNVQFDIVRDDFPIPLDAGILGKKILRGNVVVDWCRGVLIIPEQISVLYKNVLIIPARSNCVMLINADDEINHELVTITKKT